TGSSSPAASGITGWHPAGTGSWRRRVRPRASVRAPPRDSGSVSAASRGLTECEAIRLDARGAEGDLDRPVGGRPPLADQLVEPLLGHHAVTLLVDVEAVGGTGWLSIDEHAERHGIPSRRWAQD